MSNRIENLTPASLPCSHCGDSMLPYEPGLRLFVCQASPLHTRFLTLRELEDIERAAKHQAKAPAEITATDIHWESKRRAETSTKCRRR